MSSPNSRKTEDRETYRKAVELRRAGNETACIALLLELVERESECWEVYNELATLAFDSGETETALQFLDMAIAREDIPGAASLNKARVLLRMGKVQDALMLARQYLPHHPDDVQAKALIAELEPPVEVERPGLPKLIAYYLPQFHPTPENDLWWGKGFTEWTNVVRAKPLFPEHKQPRLPTDLGFYDLRLAEVRNEQAALARKYGIYGFCYYHYWFADGKRLLERPLDEVLRTGQPDFPFCICWANESWTRRWDGGEDLVLMRQDPSADNAMAFIRNLVPLLNDPRYIRVAGKPMILIYRIDMIPGIARIAQMWREEMRKQGVGEIYLMAVQTTVEINPEDIGFDASCEFPPHQLPRNTYNERCVFNQEFSGKAFDYREAVRTKQREHAHPYKRFSGVMTAWDNTPRRKHRAHLFLNATPAWYKHWLTHTIRNTTRNFAPEERFVFINAWNEWAEGAYLEPDEHNGYDFLEATRDALSSVVPQTTPLDKYDEISGDAPSDDPLWDARSRAYRDTIRFTLYVDCASARQEAIDATCASIAAQSYAGHRTVLLDARDEDHRSRTAPENENWTISLRAGDMLTRRCLHVIAEHIFTNPEAHGFYANVATYEDSPWDSRYAPLPPGASFDEASSAECLIALSRTGFPGLQTKEKTGQDTPTGTMLHIPHFVGLRKASPGALTKRPYADFDAIWPTLPWKPVPRIVAHTGTWGDRRFDRLEAPLNILCAARQIELKIVNNLPTPATLNAFEANVLYLHNPVSAAILESVSKIRQETTLFCVFSFDPNSGEFPEGIPDDRLLTIAALCDRIIVTSEDQAARFRAVHQDVIVIPEAIPDAWGILKPRATKAHSKLRVGWVSDPMSPVETALLIDIVTRIGNRIDWVCLGNCPDSIRGIVAEQYEEVPLEQAPEYFGDANLDIALVPLETGRKDGSSLMRILRFGACGYPVITSDEEAHRQGLPVTLVENDSATWIEAIRRFADTQTRAPMVESLKQVITEKHLLSHVKNAWATALLRHTAPRPIDNRDHLPTPPPDEEAYRQAKAHIDRGDIEKGIQRLIALAESGTSVWQVYNELGVYAMQTDDHESAIGLFRHALNLNPQSVNVSENLEQALNRTGPAS